MAIVKKKKEKKKHYIHYIQHKDIGACAVAKAQFCTKIALRCRMLANEYELHVRVTGKTCN